MICCALFHNRLILSIDRFLSSFLAQVSLELKSNFCEYLGQQYPSFYAQCSTQYTKSMRSDLLRRCVVEVLCNSSMPSRLYYQRDYPEEPFLHTHIHCQKCSRRKADSYSHSKSTGWAGVRKSPVVNKISSKSVLEQ